MPYKIKEGFVGICVQQNIQLTRNECCFYCYYKQNMIFFYDFVLDYNQ